MIGPKATVNFCNQVVNSLSLTSPINGLFWWSLSLNIVQSIWLFDVRMCEYFYLGNVLLMVQNLLPKGEINIIFGFYQKKKKKYFLPKASFILKGK